MIKNTLMIMAICAVATSCTSTKDMRQKKEENTPLPLNTEPSKSIIEQFKQHDIDIVVSEMKVEGNKLILILEGNECFADKATILIPDASDINMISNRLKSIIQIHAERESKPIVAISFLDGDKVPVQYE